MPMRVSRVAVACGVLVGLWGSTPAAAQDEIDTFMKQVLERRAQNWITLHDYVLDEREEFALVGSGRVTLQSFRREYNWYVRDGYLIRSPVRFDGVEIDEPRRREFEADWLRQEQRRDTRRQRQKRPMSRRSIADNVTRSIERLWDDPVDRDLVRAIAEDARLWGDDFAAIVAASDRILVDLGGIETVGFGRTVERVRDGFVMLEEERLDRDEVARMLTAVVPLLADAVPDAGDAEHEQLVGLLTLAVEFDLPLEVDDALAQAQGVLTATGRPARAEALKDAREVLAAVVPPADPVDPAASGAPDPRAKADPIQLGLQPRFVSESYFLDFEFEPGNYYFSGREEIAGREVVRIEYYPDQLFSDGDDLVEEPDRDEEIETGFDQTSLVMLWIDPKEFQIVKFTFDNVGFDFLPLRWLVRLDDLKASMTMGQPIEGVWLPEKVELTGKVTLATGSFDVTYSRTFSDYRQADVRARIRSYVSPQN